MNFSKHLYWVLPLSMVIATTGSINASYAGFDFKNKTKQTIAVPDLEPTRIIIDTPARRAPVQPAGKSGRCDRPATSAA